MCKTIPILTFTNLHIIYNESVERLRVTCGSAGVLMDGGRDSSRKGGCLMAARPQCTQQPAVDWPGSAAIVAFKGASTKRLSTNIKPNYADGCRPLKAPGHYLS